MNTRMETRLLDLFSILGESGRINLIAIAETLVRSGGEWSVTLPSDFLPLGDEEASPASGSYPPRPG